ncbi:DUF2149 domain-containing protein [Jatrophihabitans endophyticus]|uniref:DUF2149 domain-containing protein n=1 Tax=Jatrophihabitans endophyticus TaxID=1206085 RepID=UPI0026EF2ECB|nr:DUF2149 domain-containing protein [Jatrophihabitans endophyticus]
MTPRAHRRGDHAGDPLDGLVNLFDVGVVLAVGFLLAALASLNLTGSLTHGTRAHPKDEVTVGPSDQVSTVAPSGQRTAGRGRPVGRVYRLRNGTLIVVVPSHTTTVSPGPSR